MEIEGTIDWITLCHLKKDVLKTSKNNKRVCSITTKDRSSQHLFEQRKHGFS
jgi:hypothetical protein